MTWNHRILFHPEHGSETAYFAVHECFYGRKGAKIPHSWTEEPIRIIEDSMPDLQKTLKRMLKACTQPTLRITKGNKLVVYRRTLGKGGD